MFGGKRQKYSSTCLRRICLGLLTGIVIISLFCSSAFLLEEKKVIIEGVSIAGIPLSGLGPEQAAVFLSHRLGPLLEHSVELRDSNSVFGFIPNKWGFFLDYKELVSEAFTQGRAGSIFLRWRKRRELRLQPVNIVPAVRINPEMYERFLGFLERQVNKQAVAADLLVNREGEIKVTPGRPGRRLQRQGFLSALSRVILTEAENRYFELPVEQVKPALSDEEIKDWDLTRVLAYFTTRFDPVEGERAHNIRTAAFSLHGTLVLPRQRLSFNHRVGLRVPERGYREAPILYEGRLVPGIGGGVCQVSTALYNVWLLAGFPVVKRSNHTIPISYVEMGRDAAVVDGGQDLVVTNPLSTPVFISAQVETDVLTVAVLGKQENHRVDAYSLESKVVQTIPPPETRIEDTTLGSGEEFLVEVGREGYIVELWRLALDSEGQVLRREFIDRSFYQPAPRLLRTGKNAHLRAEEPEGAGE